MVGFEYSTFVPSLALLYTHVAVKSRGKRNRTPVSLVPKSVQKMQFFEKTANLLPRVLRGSFPQVFSRLWETCPPTIARCDYNMV